MAKITGAEAGWRLSRYNLSARVDGTDKTAIVNLMRGTCGLYAPIELFLLSSLDAVSESHPLLERFVRGGVIVNYDEAALLNVMGRASFSASQHVKLVICPTLACNFDCPYCFENHSGGVMSEAVQDDVAALAERLLAASGTRLLHVTWFGGEPLLAPRVIESLSKRMMDAARRHDARYQAAIITNGYLFTQPIVDMLATHGVEECQVTLDGIGATHDNTRGLANGGPSFERIAENLATLRIPFPVKVRHNLHEGNVHEADALHAEVRRWANDSGNDLRYYATPVFDSATARERGGQVSLLCSWHAGSVAAARDAVKFKAGRGHYCGASSLWCVAVDMEGGLHKCQNTVDKPEWRFAHAHDWDPADPAATAACVDRLTVFANAALPTADEECAVCIWLPLCNGGCPLQRMTLGKACIPYKDNPREYVLALVDRLSATE